MVVVLAQQQPQQQQQQQQQSTVTMNPLTLAPLPARGAPPAAQWARHQDGADVWYTNGQGECTWVLPPGAVLRATG